MDFSFDFMALKISKQVSDRFLVSMAMIIILELLIINYRRKFRSQASDNMDRWKGRGGKNQRREEKRREEEEEEEDQRRERVRRKRVQVREKVEKSRNTVFSNVWWLQRVEK